MFKQKPFPFSLLVLAVLLALHVVGSYYSLYWIYPWFDVVVHVVSGLWIALVFLWLSSVLGQINSLREYKVKSLLIALVSALLIGVAWELFENLSQTAFVSSNIYSLNTAFDLFNDGLGGILAFLYFVRRKRSVDRCVDVLHPFYSQTGIIKS